MLYSRAFIKTLREAPSDAACASHALMLRAGLIRRLANGLFSWLPPGLRSFRKLEAIVRGELAAAGALEIKPPVITPGELWRESGRWDAMGDTMLRARNRLGDDLVVSPTAEEAFCAIVRGELSSYRDLPLTLYQINTKYRDEIRPRYGVMRAREFTMMDAYSFDTDEASLDASYRAMAIAYRKIFERCGLVTIEVKADTGAMGGAASEEFMVESEIGDDTLLVCPACGYSANVEKASCASDGADSTVAGDAGDAPRKVPTPNARTIDELVAFLGAGAETFIKTLVYEVRNPTMGPFADEAAAPAFVAACIRGDLELNEAKLAAALGAGGLTLASDDDVARITGAPVGFAGPVGLVSVPVVADPTVMAMRRAFTGALERDMHYADVVPTRDFAPALVADIRTVKAGDRCVECGAELRSRKGNELGHVFKLGTKYSEPMRVAFLDAEGKERVALMGCYGIGMDRTLASVVEARHDDDGIVWPAALAPYEAIVVPVRYEGAMREAADGIYRRLLALGVDALLDDRDERAGVKFKDADLVGIPARIVVGDKKLPGEVELKRRGEKEARIVPIGEVAALVKRELDAEKAKG